MLLRHGYSVGLLCQLVTAEGIVVLGPSGHSKVYLELLIVGLHAGVNHVRVVEVVQVSLDGVLEEVQVLGEVAGNEDGDLSPQDEGGRGYFADATPVI